MYGSMQKVEPRGNMKDHGKSWQAGPMWISSWETRLWYPQVTACSCASSSLQVLLICPEVLAPALTSGVFEHCTSINVAA